MDFDEVLGQFAQRIGAATRTDVADALGISLSDYGNRRRRGRIPWDRIVEVCAARGVSVDALLVPEGDEGVREERGCYRCTGRNAQYREAVESVLDACERAAVTLPPGQLRRLIEYLAAEGVTPERVDALLGLIRAGPGTQAP